MSSPAEPRTSHAFVQIMYKSEAENRISILIIIYISVFYGKRL